MPTQDEVIVVVCPCQNKSSDFRPGVIVETRFLITHLHPQKWTKPILGQRWSVVAKANITFVRGYEDWVVWKGVCPACGEVHTRESLRTRELLSDPMAMLKFHWAEEEHLQEMAKRRVGDA